MQMLNESEITKVYSLITDNSTHEESYYGSDGYTAKEG